MPDDLERRLGDLVRQESALYEELDHLLLQEEKTVVEGDIEALLLCLQEKQSVISRQQLLREEWDRQCRAMGCKGSPGEVSFWENLSDVLGEAGYNGLVTSIRTIRDAVARLLEREEKVQKLLEGQINELRSQLLQLQKGKSAFIGYAKAGSLGPMIGDGMRR